MGLPVGSLPVVNCDSKILNQRNGVNTGRSARHATCSRGGAKEVADMGYIIAWLLGVPVTLLVLFWLFFGR
jgi:hypothetical protein